MQAQVLQIRARCGEMVERIKALYGMDLSQVRISFDLKGRAAGRAGGKGYRMPGSAYWVKFNVDMLTREAFEHVITNTVPHEYAHVVCYMDPSKGSKHNYGWEQVCRALGGSGATRHTEEVVYGKGKTYEYTTDCGHTVRVSQAIHNKILKGAVYTYQGGKGKINAASPHSIVGISGQTLAKPIVRHAPNHPVVIESFVREAAAKPEAPSFESGLSKVAIARAVMLAAHKGGRSYSEIIRAVCYAAKCDEETAGDIYWANHEKLGLPAAPETV